jgi:hypothetical protein
VLHRSALPMHAEPDTKAITVKGAPPAGGRHHG